jgi:hypothetical protein
VATHVAEIADKEGVVVDNGAAEESLDSEALALHRHLDFDDTAFDNEDAVWNLPLLEDLWTLIESLLLKVKQHLVEGIYIKALKVAHFLKLLGQEGLDRVVIQEHLVFHMSEVAWELPRNVLIVWRLQLCTGSIVVCHDSSRSSAAVNHSDLPEMISSVQKANYLVTGIEPNLVLDDNAALPSLNKEHPIAALGALLNNLDVGRG